MHKQSQGLMFSTLADYRLCLQAADGGHPYVLVFKVKGLGTADGAWRKNVSSKVRSKGLTCPALQASMRLGHLLFTFSYAIMA